MKIVNEYKGFKANQLVLDLNNTLARIVYIEIDDDMNEKYQLDPPICIVRLALIDKEGFEFANCTNTIDVIKPINKPSETTNEQPKCKQCKSVIYTNKVCNCPTGEH